jgi:hypothetical protein
MNMRYKMERRMNARIPRQLHAAVRYRGKGLNRRLSASTRNLSYDGAFLEIGEDTHLNGSIVRLELEAASDDPLIIDALVVHSNPEGLGLMFAYYSHKVYEQLAALLESKPKKPEAKADSGADAAFVKATVTEKTE